MRQKRTHRETHSPPRAPCLPLLPLPELDDLQRMAELQRLFGQPIRSLLVDRHHYREMPLEAIAEEWEVAVAQLKKWLAWYGIEEREILLPVKKEALVVEEAPAEISAAAIKVKPLLFPPGVVSDKRVRRKLDSRKRKEEKKAGQKKPGKPPEVVDKQAPEEQFNPAEHAKPSSKPVLPITLKCTAVGALTTEIERLFFKSGYCWSKVATALGATLEELRLWAGRHRGAFTVLGAEQLRPLLEGGGEESLLPAAAARTPAVYAPKEAVDAGQSGVLRAEIHVQLALLEQETGITLMWAVKKAIADQCLELGLNVHQFLVDHCYSPDPQAVGRIAEELHIGWTLLLKIVRHLNDGQLPQAKKEEDNHPA